MKKIMYPAVAALVALTACTKTELTVPEHSSAISFEAPVVAPATKAAPYTQTRNVLYGTTFPTDWSFNVQGQWYADTYTGWAGTKAYMPLSVVSYDEAINPSTSSYGGWQSEKTYYWPKTGKMAFQAYYADKGTPTITNTGLTLTDYEAAVDGSQKDIMYATPIYDKTSASSGTTTYDGVQIPFKHALSAIKFTAKTDKDYSGTTKIILHKITVSGLGTKASFAQNSTFNAGYTDAPAWTAPTEKNNYELTVKGSTGYELVYNNVETCNAWYSGEAVTDINDLLVIPQDFTSNADATITVDYAISTYNGTSWNDEVPQTFTKKLNELTYSDSSKAFKVGRIYTFNMIFGLDEIFFSPEVTDWTAITVSAGSTKDTQWN